MVIEILKEILMDKFLIEVSFEAANKVGGIYTVLKEKAKYIKEKFGDSYFFIGPFISSKGFQDFVPLNLPNDFKKVVEATENFGVKVYYGEWLIEGRPRGFLIDYENFFTKVNVFKYELWDKYRIDSSRTKQDYDEPVVWSKAVSIFLKNFCLSFPTKKIVIHLHEWLSGPVILFENFSDFEKVKTIFTTHATVLGRALASSGINFWNNLGNINPEEEAQRYQIEAKHCVEKSASKKADFFTVVSSILALEAEKFLGRKPDFILFNGIDFSKFPTVEEIAQAHRKYRETLKEFILFFFSPYYKAEVSDALIFFISGRQEIKNKGIDITIRALSNLNKKLTENDKNIYVFIFVPTNVVDIDHIILSNLNIYRSIHEKLEEMGSELKSRLLHYLIHREDAECKSVMTNEEMLAFLKMFSQIKKSNSAPVSTHILAENDSIANLLKDAGLINKKDDKVKVIYYPIYLSSTDGFLNLNYADAVIGSHLGIFPSFYEPWGYTPLETAASGVLTVTTDLTGFADYLKDKGVFSSEFPGIFILKRKGLDNYAVINNLTDILYKIAKTEREGRVQNKLEARRLAQICDWKNLIKNYLDLYERTFGL